MKLLKKEHKTKKKSKLQADEEEKQIKLQADEAEMQWQ